MRKISSEQIDDRGMGNGNLPQFFPDHLSVQAVGKIILAVMVTKGAAGITCNKGDQGIHHTAPGLENNRPPLKRPSELCPLPGLGTYGTPAITRPGCLSKQR